MSAKPLPALILAGGLSRRMGMPKALAMIGGTTLVERVADIMARQAEPVLVNANHPDIAVDGLVSIADRIDGFHGPLAGIAAGLAHVATELPAATHVLVVPVDCPFLPDDLMARLLAAKPDADTIVLAASRGQTHPVVGLWPVLLAGALTDWLTEGRSRKLWDVLEGRDVRIVDFADCEIGQATFDPFINLNTPEDLARAIELAEVRR